MSLAPAIAGTAAATSAAGFTVTDRVFVYIGAAILFGLIGLIPLLAGKPEPELRPTPPDWDVMDDESKNSAPLVTEQPMTIDGEVTEVQEIPKLTGRGSRWGR
ncbi:hypothetical protein [Burkholderia sp. USMB20]|uniref:hypothetical protein n=1 Tax=Burkholderia sp. USMB20 TaxID=1571773 RepID=UPI0005CF809E|nr:hypothetical protein [Burkholderia sp. USMB20]TGN96940.1 hypothetical protein PL79_016465 [Burkholderia sp. USMB20]